MFCQGIRSFFCKHRYFFLILAVRFWGSKFSPFCWAFLMRHMGNDVTELRVDKVLFRGILRDVTSRAPPQKFVEWALHFLAGGFKYFYSFTPVWGRFPIWLVTFLRWVEPTNQTSVFGCQTFLLINSGILSPVDGGIVQKSPCKRIPKVVIQPTFSFFLFRVDWTHVFVLKVLLRTFKMSNLNGGFKHFCMFTSTLGKWSNLTSIFFRWVGSTTSEVIRCHLVNQVIDAYSELLVNNVSLGSRRSQWWRHARKSVTLFRVCVLECPWYLVNGCKWVITPI